ncbi:MAG: hypothetical protein JNK15_02700 [Planctomycetes bacterium]|nr:hypothetical protein [Planctomycetota bacterium]
MVSRPGVRVAWLFALLVPTTLSAQDPAPAPSTAQEPEFAAVVEKWLASDQVDRDALDKTVAALLKDQRAGIAWLGAQIPAAQQKPAEPRSKGILSLVSHATLAVLERTRATNIVFVGQYDTLAPLQPVVGELLFAWLVDTPDWYPSTHRIHLTAPLRDLMPKPPTPERVEAIEQIAADEHEPEALRRATAAMAWQWGKKANAQKVLAGLNAATAEGDSEDRVQATLELADFLVLLREYKQAANTHRAAQKLAQDAKVTLRPIAWYAAACVHALLGDVDRGIAALEQCAKLQASPDLDPSLRMARSMFDTDPELQALRGHARWRELVDLACKSSGPDKVGR